MNYTENYHLPQWEETDRVMRTDFNQMCADIDGGLSELKEKSAAAGVETEWIRLAVENQKRDVYRAAVQQRVHHGPVGISDTMWLNPLASWEDTGGEGHGWDGQYGIYHGTQCLLSLDRLRETAVEESYLITSPGAAEQCRRAATSFVSNAYGTLNTVTMWFWWRTNLDNQNPLPFTIKLIRLDTGAVMESPQSMPLNTNYPQLTVNFPLEAKTAYRLEVVLPEEIRFYGEGGFLLGTDQYPLNGRIEMTLSGRKAAQEIAKSIQAPHETRGALGIMRWQGAGTAALLINGTPLPQLRTRAALNALGQPCQETEFQITALPPETFTLTLRVAGEIRVFDYGLLWQ